MKAPRKFEHPSRNGYTETVSLSHMIPIALFGSFFFLFKGMWFWALIAWPIIAISGLVAAFAVASVLGFWAAAAVYMIMMMIAARGCLDYLAERYLKRGWHEVSTSNSPRTID